VAVTVTDLRTIRNEADATTGWTGTTSLVTSDPDPVEATGCLGASVSTATLDGYHTGASVNLSNALIYVWALGNGTMASRLATGIALHLGDGTNRIAFQLAGSDAAAFRHNDGPVGWQCLVVDGANLPSDFATRAGTRASLNMSAITQIGITFTTLSKALGGAVNCFIDIIRHGTGEVLRISGGTSGDPGIFDEVAALDRSTVNQRAHGVIRRFSTGLYGVQGPLQFGDPTSGNTYFLDSDVSVVFEARGFSTTRYRMVVRKGTGTTHFQLGYKVGSGASATGRNGCNLTAPTGVGAAFDSGTDTTVTDVFIYGSQFSGFTGGITLGGSQEFIGNIVAASGAITCAGVATLVNTTVQGSTVAANASALVWNNATDVDGYLDGMVFSMGANNHHAIELGASSPTTLTLRGLSFSGFSGSNNVDGSVLHVKRTTGTVTINLVDVVGTVSYRSDGATVVLVNARSLTLTGLRVHTEVRVFAAGTGTEIAGQEDVITGTFQTGIDAATYPNIDIAIISLGYQNIRLLNVSMASDQTIPIQQQIDRQYENP
jgi:hypothetical protein